MERLTREQIRENIILDLEKAYSSKNQEISYWLEKLPMIEESDEVVHDYMSMLEHDIRHQDRDSFDFNVDELVEHYFINQEQYDFD